MAIISKDINLYNSIEYINNWWDKYYKPKTDIEKAILRPMLFNIGASSQILFPESLASEPKPRLETSIEQSKIRFERALKPNGLSLEDYRLQNFWKEYNNANNKELEFINNQFNKIHCNLDEYKYPHVYKILNNSFWREFQVFARHGGVIDHHLFNKFTEDFIKDAKRGKTYDELKYDSKLGQFYSLINTNIALSQTTSLIQTRKEGFNALKANPKSLFKSKESKELLNECLELIVLAPKIVRALNQDELFDFINDVKGRGNDLFDKSVGKITLSKTEASDYWNKFKNNCYKHASPSMGRR